MLAEVRRAGAGSRHEHPQVTVGEKAGAGGWAEWNRSHGQGTVVFIGSEVM
ncbi:hypothetical protein BN2497_12265 [Janthinobacterium sp. CG23_2]|nr:hypothetical protein BN2497_12265 [Janthinobacterium sp. CG23_2]CUU32530.1 hypothetical protein BN3177_12265 [Janthinobacterium sp. CG23_2]